MIINIVYWLGVVALTIFAIAFGFERHSLSVVAVCVVGVIVWWAFCMAMEN